MVRVTSAPWTVITPLPCVTLKSRMDKAAPSLTDIDKDTVDFQDNYDGKDREPTFFPPVIPTCWSMALAVLPLAWPPIFRPTTLGEVIDATLALIETLI